MAYRNLLAGLAIGAAAMAIAPVANATVYTGSTGAADWTSAIGGTVKSLSVVGTPGTTAGSTISFLGGPTLMMMGPLTNASTSGFDPDNYTGMIFSTAGTNVITFASPVTAFGFYIEPTSGTSVSVTFSTLTNGSGTTTTVMDPTGGPIFFGYSGAAISSFKLGGAVTVGDFQTAAVPEPASVALLGVGLVGFGLMRRRRKQQG